MTDWRGEALCRGKPTSLWYPKPGDWFATQVAVTICRRCPVRCECLADAVAVEDEFSRVGIRGGLTAEQRRRLTLRRRQLAG